MTGPLRVNASRRYAIEVEGSDNRQRVITGTEQGCAQYSSRSAHRWGPSWRESAILQRGVVRRGGGTMGPESARVKSKRSVETFTRTNRGEAAARIRAG